MNGLCIFYDDFDVCCFLWFISVSMWSLGYMMVGDIFFIYLFIQQKKEMVVGLIFCLWVFFFVVDDGGMNEVVFYS